MSKIKFLKPYRINPKLIVWVNSLVSYAIEGNKFAEELVDMWNNDEDDKFVEKLEEWLNNSNNIKGGT
jgi:hypothetical protein